jgi:hypothetical protein
MFQQIDTEDESDDVVVFAEEHWPNTEASTTEWKGGYLFDTFKTIKSYPESLTDTNFHKEECFRVHITTVPNLPKDGGYGHREFSIYGRDSDGRRVKIIVHGRLLARHMYQWFW